MTADTKARLRAAAISTIRELGIAGVSARTVASRADCNQAAIYYHFGSLHDLLADACVAATQARVAAHRDRLASVTTVPELIEVATSSFGIKRARLVTPDGKFALAPIPGTWEYKWIGWHERNPGPAKVVSAASFLVLAVAAVVGLPQMLELASQIYNESDLHETVGVAWSFTSPVSLSATVNTGVTIAAAAAALERAWRLKYNPLLDGGVLGDIDF